VNARSRRRSDTPTSDVAEDFLSTGTERHRAVPSRPQPSTASRRHTERLATHPKTPDSGCILSDNDSDQNANAAPNEMEVVVMDRLLTVEQAAERLGTTPRFIRRLTQERRIPYTKLGGSKVRIRESDLDAFISNGIVESRTQSQVG
jgi:excisionase family DNA binding protein